MVTARSRQAGTVADRIAQVPAEAPDYLPMWVAGSGLLMLLFFFSEARNLNICLKSLDLTDNYFSLKRRVGPIKPVCRLGRPRKC